MKKFVIKLNKPLLIRVVLLAAVIYLLAGVFGDSVWAQTGNTYYVDINSIGGSCSDSNPGTMTEPWQHLSYAGTQVYAGDTVYLRGGSYIDDYFWPLHSGTQNNPITVQAYPGEIPILTGTGYYDAFINIGWSGDQYFVIDGLYFENTTGNNVILLSDVTHNIIRNCHFSNHEGTMMNINLGGYNIIENNYFDTTGDPSDAGAGDHIYLLGTDYNLIQNNYFTKAGHASIDLIDYMSTEFCEYNIIRNNTIEQHWGSGIGLIRGTSHTLVENNKIYYVGEQVTTYPKSGIMIVADHNIVRNNLIVKTSAYPFRNNGMTFEGYVFQGYHQNSTYNAVYNNVIYKSGKEALFVTQRQDCIVTGNKFLNNILYYNRVGGSGEQWLPDGNYYLIFETYHAYANNKWTEFPNYNYFHHNLMLHADSTGDHPGEDPFIYYEQESWGHSLAWVDEHYPAYFYDNIEQNPLFVDAEAGDFHLQTGSPAIDAGDFLTRTTLTGSNINVVEVQDASYFCDGFGITEADTIQVGSNNPVSISGINYNTNEITVSIPISFNQGDIVSLEYNGSAPDMGAFEYQEGVVVEEYPVYVYPNPCRVYQGENTITFSGDLNIGDNIKVYDMSGRIAHNSGNLSETTYEWGVSDIASGVFFFVVKSSDGNNKASGKIAVIR